MREPTPDHDHWRRRHGGTLLAKDPVCGMDVDPHTAKHQADHAGRSLLFLLGRLPRRSSSPTRRSISRRRTGERRRRCRKGTIYTCPMHPEIRQVGPGTCPICGMALEPVTRHRGDAARIPSSRHDAALLDRRWCWPLPVVVLEMGGHLTDLHMLSRPADLELAAARARDAGGALGGLAVLRARLGLARERGNLNMFTLIAMGTGVAWALQRRRQRCCPGFSRAALRGTTARSRSTSRRRRSSPCWCCSARCWSCGRASRPAAPSGRCSISRRRRARRIVPDGTDEEVALERGRGRRPAARAAGREGAGRRRRGRGPQRRSTNRW